MKIINQLLDIIYPNVCGICNKINKNFICNKCKIKLDKIKKCKVDYYKNNYFNKHMYIFDYKDIISGKIIDYKFNDKAYLYKTFAYFIIGDKKICGFLKSYDIIIPVPISKKRNVQRGYNQCELIVREIAKKYDKIRFSNQVLFKIKDTKPQSKLSKEERKTNLDGAYIIKNESIINNKKILLFDDVFTTGSTVKECSKILKMAGAKEIGILTIAKD